jgi:hypothetical protein
MLANVLLVRMEMFPARCQTPRPHLLQQVRVWLGNEQFYAMVGMPVDWGIGPPAAVEKVEVDPI